MYRYGTPQRRKPATQVWAVGEQVKVGFLSLRITKAARNGGWILVNKDATKHYLFEPHMGLLSISQEEACAA